MPLFLDQDWNVNQFSIHQSPKSQQSIIHFATLKRLRNLSFVVHLISSLKYFAAAGLRVYCQQSCLIMITQIILKYFLSFWASRFSVTTFHCDDDDSSLMSRPHWACRFCCCVCSHWVMSKPTFHPVYKHPSTGVDFTDNDCRQLQYQLCIVGHK